MPALRQNLLIGRVLSAIAASGATAIQTSAERRNPRIFRVTRDRTSYDLWVYIWTVTHGGASRSEEEFRIQKTSVEVPLPRNPDGPTVLIGWDEVRHVFAGFDFELHRSFTPGSPSAQVPLSVLSEARTTGFAVARKSNDELTYAFTPENFLNYVDQVSPLHREAPAVEELVRRAIAAPEVPLELAQLPEGRRRVVLTVQALSRDARFRRGVLNAYVNRCAVTGCQLGLLDAAHILPVGAPRSHDGITNGLALSPTYHRAFDAGLIYLDPTYVMRINEARVRQLRADGLDGGYPEFAAPLGRRIHLPRDVQFRPDPEMVRLANVYRRIPG